MEGSVNHTISKGIATITFYHPQSNSLPGNILNDLAERITFLGNQKDAMVIVLKSEGDRAFCAGASFDELMAIESKEAGEIFFMGFAKVINAMRKCPKLIIGRVQGKAVGGGVGMASAVDYCLATKYAAVKLSELALGIGPGVGEPGFVRHVHKQLYSVLYLIVYFFQKRKQHIVKKDGPFFTKAFQERGQVRA